MTGPGPGWNYGETAVFTFGRKAFFWPKSKKETPQKSSLTIQTYQTFIQPALKVFE